MVTKSIIFILVLLMVITAGCASGGVFVPAKVITTIVKDSGAPVSVVRVTIDTPNGETDVRYTNSDGDVGYSPNGGNGDYTITPTKYGYEFDPTSKTVTWTGSVSIDLPFEAISIPIWYRDRDEDGYGDSYNYEYAYDQPEGHIATGGDCDDNDDMRHPGLTEICDNFIDDDCDWKVDLEDDECAHLWYRDSDGDGYGDPLIGSDEVNQPAGYVANANDCNDSNASVHPGAIDYCNSIDEDCTGDESDCLPFPKWYPDADGDGYGANDRGWVGTIEQPEGMVANCDDCHDDDPNVNPRDGEEILNSGVDENCDGVSVGTRFTIFNWTRGGGYVRDNNTGLLWDRSPSTGHKTWNYWGMDYCKFGDACVSWRFPDMDELKGLMDTRYSNPTLCNMAGNGSWTQGNPWLIDLGVSGQYWDHFTNMTCVEAGIHPANLCDGSHHVALDLYDGITVRIPANYEAHMWAVQNPPYVD